MAKANFHRKLRTIAATVFFTQRWRGKRGDFHYISEEKNISGASCTLKTDHYSTAFVLSENISCLNGDNTRISVLWMSSLLLTVFSPF